ncbi:hypothetical protein ACFW2D_27495 [Streptomyces sp. NPDC058914]|uniref:hypothetical protein n=1 Tax=Streptomyces sp. NPDC058914 TaxID=3346671 RepID=UPI0036766D89
MNTFNFHHSGPGDNVNMVNTSHSIGIVKGQTGDAEQVIAQLRQELRELPGLLSPEDARTVGDSLPVVADGTRTPGERRAALVALSGAVAALGTAGQSAMDMIQGLLGLLGG